VNSKPKKVCIYSDGTGKEPFTIWADALPGKERARIFTRLDRIEAGNLGDYKSVGGGVYELRFHFGPGYRVYFGEMEEKIVLLLCGGDKSSQKKDVLTAKKYWIEWLNRGEQ
jgi:putative addiction module killer protein